MNNTQIIKITLKWTIIVLVSLILWVVVFPILISAKSYILPIIGLILIPIWFCIIIILLIKQAKQINKQIFKQTNK